MDEAPILKIKRSWIILILFLAVFLIVMGVALGWLFVVKLYISMLVIIVTIFWTEKRIVVKIKNGEE